MKKLLLPLLMLVALAGCANVSKSIVDGAALVRQSMDALLPSDFNGPVDLSRVDGYFEIRLRGEPVLLRGWDHFGTQGPDYLR